MAGEKNPLPEGSRVGRWTVLGDAITNAKGETKRHCRCDCGTERYVLERSLKYGESQSCGCLARELSSQACAHNLQGKTFGDLTVVGKSRKQAKAGILWTCLCTCGYTCEATAYDLLSGRKNHCGCKSTKSRPYTDISGQRFGMLTALVPTNGRTGGGSVVWHCRCDCGKETDVPYNDLVHANQRSCGCRKRAHEQELGKYLTHVDGTCIDSLKSKRIPSNNTTGVKGVYYTRGKYLAKIVFQKKQFALGTYDNLEDAAKARKLAEKTLSEEVVSFYEKWKEKATADPEWAKANPVKILVNKGENAELRVNLMPSLV